MRILTRADIQKACPMPKAIEIVRNAFAQLSAGHANVPMRLSMPLPREPGAMLVMPGSMEDPAAIGTKIVSVAPGNLARGLSRIQAVYLLNDPSTGEPLALLDGAYLTALRTGAASGVATDLLARQDAKVVAIIGSGTQARFQLAAVAAVRRLERVLVYSPTPQHVQDFLLDLIHDPSLPRDMKGVATAHDAVAGADIVCAATTSKNPVFDGKDVQTGVHVNGIGSYTPQMQEVDAEFLRRCSKVVVDQRGAAWAEAGDLIQARDQGAFAEHRVYAEIGELCSGAKPGRENADEITFFKSVGNAVQDVAVAQHVYAVAAKQGLGREVRL